ncbi:MAG: hypothetical protein FRX48_00755 [Lasallia pustulata]|uniref:NmrA-like family domain-containing protein 1 n=1 Tax=Lasallia pustulata TaxID=136370 RepID=A0A5M8Q1J6_9LECA|nr:MAG: hypothetical protein FRX48_00755 [Lasallia pustulata]
MSSGEQRKVVVVFGATGLQGGSIIEQILSDPKASSQFSIRGITRDPTKPAAKALTAKGVDCVAADLEDKPSLRKAFEGAYAAYAVTNYWEKLSAEIEVQQGKNVADVAKAVGLQHLIWSSLPNVTKLSGGALSQVYHFDSKADVEEYIRKIGVPATFFMPGFYMSNIPGNAFAPNPENGTYRFALPIPPNSPMPLFDTGSDTGKFVKAILLNREKCLGKNVLGATDYYTPEQIVEQFKEVKPKAGHGATYAELPPEVYKGFLAKAGLPEFAQEELLQNMQLMPQFGYYGGASLKESHDLVGGGLTTWSEFAAKTPAWKDLD